jgi:hypothetical protein
LFHREIEDLIREVNRMRFRSIVATALATALIAPVFVQAEEGMWPIDELKKLDFKRLEKMGLELEAKEIFDGKGGGIAGAIVSLGGGTGSFVSPEGLILTNHHVAFTALQRASSEEHNYIEEGFNAESLEDEIPAHGYRAYVLLDIKDVTKKVLGAVDDGMSDVERYEAIEQRIKEIVEEAERDRDVECSVEDFFDGMIYKLFTYFTIKDIRIAYAPPRAIGNYGGDIDNWMWPRHTGDFSFLRAYVSPDGSSADYAEENMPYSPPVHLAVSTAGVKEGDYTMILGYPGRTMRYRTSNSVAHHQEYNYPSRIAMFGDLIAIYQEAAAADPGVAIKVASYDQMLNNSMKNYQGMLEGFEKAGLLQNKLREEAEFTAWLEGNKKMKEKYGHILPSIAALYQDNRTFREKSQIIGIMHFPSLLLRAGSTLSRWSEEKEKPDLDREPGFQERDVPRLEQGLRMIDMNYDRETDKKVLKYFLMAALELPADQRILAVDAIVEGAESPEESVDAFIEKLYANTKLESADERQRMFGLSREELMAEKDAFVAFAGDLLVERKELEERDKAFAGALNKLRPGLIEAYSEWKGGALYPDANSTMRLTYGTVQGYSPRDAVEYDYITTLSGVIEKCTGEDPFDCPPKLVELHEKRIFGSYIDQIKGDMPVDFLSTCDITGGNSGSPILNGRGEVIGSAFDGNYESISADYIFNDELTRAINVDVRYILFVLEKFSGARYLLDEMTIR